MSILTERLELLPASYKAFLEGGFVEGVSESVTEHYLLSTEQAEQFTNSLYLFLLFFLTTEDFIRSLINEVKLSPDQTRGLCETLFEALPENFPWELANRDTVQQEIASLEKTVSELSSMRTMQSDMQQQHTPVVEKTYVSSQDALLNQPTPFDQPRPTTPRWDTETE